HFGLGCQRLLEAARDLGLGTLQPDLAHRHAEQLAILGHADGFALGTDQLDVVFLQHTMVGQIERAVEAGLAAHRGQYRVRALLGDDALHRLPVDRLDVDRVGGVRVGHDRGGVGVHQDHPVALLLQRLARLRAGVVELAGLADHDRASADDEDALDVGTFWHGFRSGTRDSGPGTRSQAGAWAPGVSEAAFAPLFRINPGHRYAAMPRLNRARGISAIAFAIQQMNPMRWRRSGRNPWWNCAHYLRRHLTVLKLPRAGVARSSHSALRAETLPSIHKRISPGTWPVATPP